MKIRALVAGASALTLMWGGAALAQPVAAAPAADTQADVDDDDSVDALVVTAERRNENLMTTAISASVLSGAELEKKGVITVDQLQFVTPGAAVNNFGQGIDFNIRGIGKAEHNTQTTTGVITYRDGVATFPGYFTAEPYYDIASVEILRGPQGTFVGQNATGGAVFVNSKDPVIGGGHGGYLMGQVGNYASLGAQGAINLPVSDTFAARLAFNADRRDSFYNITGPITGNHRPTSFSGRLSLIWQPTDTFTARFKTDYNTLNFGAYPADPVLGTNDPFNITANADLRARDRFMRSVLRLDKTFGNGVVLRSVSGYQQGNSRYAADLDGRSTGNSTFRDSVDELIYSQEINLISPDMGRVNWVLGAYWQSDEYEFLPGQFVVGTPPGNIATEYRLQGTNPKRTLAGFGQLGIELGGGFELQLGARYSDARTINHVTISQSGLPLAADQRAEYSNLSGKVSLNWTVNDHHFLYAFAATGFRPGGLNVPVGLGLPAPFDSEKVTSYEAGWKAGFLGGRLRTQLDAYYNHYENFQVIVGYPTIPVFGFELNNPNPTKMYGFEAQVEAVFGPLSFDGGLGLMRTSLGQFFATDPRIPAFGACDPVVGPSSPSCINLRGRDQTYAPEFTFNLGVQYRFDLGANDTLTPRINFGHVSPQWATLFENAARGDRIEARNIYNAQLAWTHKDIVVTAYGTNLGDQHYVGAINSGLRFVGPPRQYGVRVLKVF